MLERSTRTSPLLSTVRLLIARKVLHPAELGASQTTLGSGRELALQTTLQAGAAEPIAGYTIELFYP